MHCTNYWGKVKENAEDLQWNTIKKVVFYFVITRGVDKDHKNGNKPNLKFFIPDQ